MESLVVKDAPHVSGMISRSERHHHHHQKTQRFMYLLASGTAYMEEGCCFPLLCGWSCILGIMGDSES